MTTLVSEIQSFSIHDGPGIRTTVFLKGCPLRCLWCHNPECISPEAEELYYPEKCIGCGRCSEGCFAGARVISGREMSPEEVMSEVLRDKGYYGREGGLTVSGGEPLMHRDFTLKLLSLARESGIGTAVESSLYIYDEEIFKLCDVVMADLKIFDSSLHKLYTGVGNEKIKENFLRLDKLGIPIIARTPVMSGVNDSRENIEATRDFFLGLKNIVKYELLPYHPLGVTKAKALRKEYREFSAPDKTKMEELKKYADLS